MGSSHSKQKRRPTQARPTQPPAPRYEVRRPADLGRPSPPRPAHHPAPRGSPMPPQPTQSHPLPRQAPIQRRRAPTPPRKNPSPPGRDYSPPTGNRQSVYWHGLTDIGYQEALPPMFATESGPGASLFEKRPLNPPAPTRKATSPPRTKTPSPQSSSNNSRDSVYFPGLTENTYQQAIPPSFVPQSLVYSSLHPATLCKRPTCPIKFAHCEGVYQHEGIPAKRNNGLWGICNPPPDIWEAQAKRREGKASEEEKEMVLRFAECHSEGYNQNWRKDDFTW